MKKSLLFWLFTAFSWCLIAQNAPLSVVYEITQLDADEIPMLSMLKGSTIEVAFDKGMSKTDVNLLFGMVRLQMFSDDSKKENITYFDMMGQRKFVRQPKNENMDMAGLAKSAGLSDIKMEKAKGKSKKIAGYKSIPYEIKGGMGEMGIKMYVTKKLKLPASSGPNMLTSMFQIPEFPGFPMMLEIDLQGMGMTIEAKEIKKNLDSDAFNQPIGYEESTMEDMMGGMAGGLGGFGGLGGLGTEDMEEVDEKEDIQPSEDVVIEAPPVPEMKEMSYKMDEVHQKPEFPGGDIALAQYFVNHLSYPQAAREKHTEGTVVVNFTIETDGTIGDVQAIRELPDGCTQEAVRLVKNMPNWKPGQHNGKPVRIQYSLPVKFSLH